MSEFSGHSTSEIPDLGAAQETFAADIREGVGEPSLAAAAARRILAESVLAELVSPGPNDEAEIAWNMRKAYHDKGLPAPEYYS